MSDVTWRFSRILGHEDLVEARIRLDKLRSSQASLAKHGFAHDPLDAEITKLESAVIPLRTFCAICDVAVDFNLQVSVEAVDSGPQRRWPRAALCVDHAVGDTVELF